MSTVEVQPAVDSTGDAKPVTIQDTKTNISTENNNAANKQMVDNGVAVTKNVKDLDELAPAKSYWTVDGTEAVKLHMTSEGHGSEKPMTVPSLFHRTVERVPNNVAVAVKRGGVWVKWTYQQYYNSVKQAAKSFIKLGLEPYHGVGIIGFNSPEWFMSDLGAIFAGGFAVGIYTTNSPEACEFVAGNCEANIIVVENNQQLQKILKVWDNLPHLKAVVQYTGEVAERKPNIYSWQEFMDLSKDVPDSALQERLALQAPNKCCTLIYTSGTTGNPKGVMISHDNITWTALKLGQSLDLKYGIEVSVSYLPLSHVAAQLQDLYIPISFGGTAYFAAPDALKLTWTATRIDEWLDYRFGCETVVSYLPLSHIAGQLLDIINPIVSGGTTYFAQPDALKGSLVETLKEVRPTGFFGVPRVWEKFMEKMQEVGRQTQGVKKKVAIWAKEVGLKGTYAMMNHESTPFGWKLANLLVFKKARVALGLDRCRLCATGAAPITKETLEFFYSLNMPLLEIYGMSECSGPQTVSIPSGFKICSVGKEFFGAKTKFVDQDEDGNGEICMYGRHVFMGYLNAEEKTRESLDDQNWLHSGDIGKKDSQGFLYITGRKKELIITAGGENIAPVPIEDNVKEALKIVSNSMLIGDKKKFLSMLLTLKVVVDPDSGEPSDVLTPEAVDWCKSKGSNATKVSDILDKKDAIVLKAIQEGIDQANKKAVSNATKVQKWSILPKDFSIPGGELGPTLKLRRPIVTKMYTQTIDAFYTG